jgi:hypothetical protein
MALAERVIPSNTATAALRRVAFQLVDATDLITPEDITVTDVKVSLSIDGGTPANSTNDIVKVSGTTGLYYLELTQSEANQTAGVEIWGTLAPSGCARTFLKATIGPAGVFAATVDLADGGITAAKFAASAITATVLADNAITANKIASDAIAAAKIASGAITSAKFASGAITSTVLASNAIGASQIASNAITDAKINTAALTAAKFGASAITSTVLADNAITDAKIASNAITAAKVAAAALPSSKFDAADPVPTNVVEINDAEVTGDGTSGDLWRGVAP